MYSVLHDIALEVRLKAAYRGASPSIIASKPNSILRVEQASSPLRGSYLFSRASIRLIVFSTLQNRVDMPCMIPRGSWVVARAASRAARHASHASLHGSFEGDPPTARYGRSGQGVALFDYKSVHDMRRMCPRFDRFLD